MVMVGIMSYAVIKLIAALQALPNLTRPKEPDSKPLRVGVGAFYCPDGFGRQR